MTDLPTGVVTFVFTDIEGSTRLLKEAPSSYKLLLERHGEIIRKAVTQVDGAVVSTEGDSFFLAFTSPVAAIRAIAEFQTHLGNEPWMDGRDISVRVGAHTGEGTLGGDNYWGIDVHRAARIAGSGHGGQVLLSNVTAALAAPHLPPEYKLRSLGTHRFKDLTEGEEVFQLIVEGLRADFPPLASLQGMPHNLPVQLDSFVPRAELAQIGELLATTRLVTLTGPGGTGKTRLALQTGAEQIGRHRDGVWFVPLAAITDPTLVTTAVGSTLALQLTGQYPDNQLGKLLHDKEMLLILDNFEQVSSAADKVAIWLKSAPALKTLVTSRAPLHISGEREFAVPTLSLTNEAVALFVDRAQVARPGFMLDEVNTPAIEAIVARLDGLPLAIELAAARLRLLSLEAIAERLDSRLGLLTGGARDLPERQRTLRSAIEWSVDLLAPSEQALFSQAAVFNGGFSLDEAEVVLRPGYRNDVLEGLEALVDQSLLRPVVDASIPRFLMLETIRELASEQLAALPAEGEMRSRHADAYLALAEKAAPHFITDQQRWWLDRVSEDHENMRSALAFLTAEGNAEKSQRLCGALWRFWQMRGFLSEGRVRTEAALDLGPGTPMSRIRALEGAGGLAYWQADGAASESRYTEQVAIARQIGDKRQLGFALYNLSSGAAVLERGDALSVITEAVSVAEEVGDPGLLGSVYWGLGSLLYLQADPADPSYQEKLQAAIEALNRASSCLGGTNLSFQIGWTDNMLAFCQLAAGRPDEAIIHLRSALERFVDAGDLSALPLQVASYAEYALQLGDIELGVTLAGASASVQRGSDTRLLDIAVNEVRGSRRAIESLGASPSEALLAAGAALSIEETLEILRKL